jgi:hypothetical protein
MLLASRQAGSKGAGQARHVFDSYGNIKAVRVKPSLLDVQFFTAAISAYICKPRVMRITSLTSSSSSSDHLCPQKG